MKKSITKKELKDFGLLITFGFPLIFGLIVPFVSGHSYKTWPFVIALTSFLLTILNPKLLLIPYKIWMRIGNILGFINSHIILGLVFYIPKYLYQDWMNFDFYHTKTDLCFVFKILPN